jgi:hypothetical protein
MVYHETCASYHHGMLCLLVEYDLYDCAMYLFWPLVCLVFIRIDAEQREYQESQDYYPGPSYSATKLLAKHFPMLAVHIVPIASILFLQHNRITNKIESQVLHSLYF